MNVPRSLLVALAALALSGADYSLPGKANTSYV